MLTLRPASRASCPFRQTMLADPATMAYNAPWAPPDGCIPFPEDKWAEWLSRWENKEPERFCGYLMDGETPVGEVCWYGHGEGMGVVIHAPHRGKGYAQEGLRLLIDRAFSHEDVTHLCNEFEEHRTAALHVHLAAGFRVTGRQGENLLLQLDRKKS